MEKLIHNNLAQRIAAVLLLLAISGAIILATLVHFHPVLLTDIKISQEIQEGGIRLLPIMLFISFFGEPLVAFITTLIAAIIFFLLRRRREAIFSLLTVIASGVNAAIKLVVHRPRPTDTLIAVYQQLTDPSFPSGHVVFYVVFFGFILTTMIVIKKLPLAARIIVGAFCIFLILFVSVSRIYLGAHWATDVIGGYCVGFILLLTLLYFYFKGLKFE